jgi:CRP-like cAMP-binding protein
VSDASELKRFALFADLGDSEREELAALLEERELSPGEMLFEAGDEADSLLLVLSGSVEVTSSRRKSRIALGSGETIGGLALFAVGNRGVAAVGSERTEVRVLRREDFLRFAEDQPRAAFRIAAALVAAVAEHARAAVQSVDPSGAGE